jgi:signal transduction histidine kinase
VRTEAGGIVVEISDDGVGVGAHVTEGVGLRSMRERTAELGGSCSVTGRPGLGTRVLVSLPRTSPSTVAG